MLDVPWRSSRINIVNNKTYDVYKKKSQRKVHELFAVSKKEISCKNHWHRYPTQIKNTTHYIKKSVGMLSPKFVWGDNLILKMNTKKAFFCMVKAYTFSFLISSIPSYFGYNVKGGALEIGRSSTRSVVVSCIAILFADYLLSALLL